MNVACPSCSTRYSVDDARIPPSGVTIKCPKCQHVFVAKKDQASSAPARAGSAVALPGSVAAGSRGGAVALPGSQAQRSAPPKQRGPEDDELDLGLDEPTSHAQKPLGAPHGPEDRLPPPPKKATPAGGTREPPKPAKSATAALDFIDETASRAGADKGSGHAPELRVRKRNGRVEGPYGQNRIITLLRNKELTGHEDISEDGLQWRSMTSQPELNRVINDIANEGESLNFGNVDLPMPAGDLPAPKGRPGKSTSSGGSHQELDLDNKGHGGGSPGDFDLGLEDDMPPPPKSNKPSVGYSQTKPAHSDSTPHAPPGSGDLEDLDLDRPPEEKKKGHAPAPVAAPPKKGGKPTAEEAAAGADALEVGEIPQLPPIWQTYKKPILIFVGVIGVFLVGFFTHLWTPCGAYGLACVAELFQPPPPPPPEKPPPPPPKVADPKEIASLIDEGSYEAFRSVFATVENLGPGLPDNMLAAAKARGFASLAYGTQAFPIAPLSKAVEALNTVDLAKAMNGNAAGANVEIQKARAALELVNNANEAAATQLAALVEQRGDDKELAYLLGLARARLGDPQGALAALDKAIVADPKYAPALHTIGDVVLATGSPEDAALWYEKALNAQPAHSRSAVAGAALFKALNRFGERRRMMALAAEKADRGLPPEQRAAFLNDTAAAFDQADMLPKVADIAAEAARLDPANVAYAALGASALAESGRSKEGLAMIDPVIVREPNNPEALLARARAYLTTEDLFTKAFVDLDAAKKVAPKDPRPLILEARFNQKIGKLTDARDALNRAVKLGGPSVTAFIDLGRLDLSVGDVDAAFNNANEAVKVDPNQAAAHALRGDCLLSRDELDKALKEYETALKLDDENVAANLGYANALRDLGAKAGDQAKVASAVPIYLKLLADNPKNSTVMFEYGRAMELQDRVQAALELYAEAAALDEKDVRPHLKIASALIEKDEPDLAEASKSIAQARKIEAGSARPSGLVRYWEARLGLLENRGHDAESAMAQAVELEPRNAIFHYWHGRALEANNSLYEAVTSYQKAVSLNSRLGLALRALGQTAIEMNQYDKAREWFDKYREAQPEDTSIWNDIGESYVRQNREDDAMKAFQTAVKANPKNGVAHLQIGNILANKGQDKDAERSFELATKHEPKLGDAWCQLGLSQARGKVTKDARRALEKCLELASSSDDLKASAKDVLETAGKSD